MNVNTTKTTQAFNAHQSQRLVALEMMLVVIPSPQKMQPQQPHRQTTLLPKPNTVMVVVFLSLGSSSVLSLVFALWSCAALCWDGALVLFAVA